MRLRRKSASNALREQVTVTDLADRYGVYLNRISAEKTHLQEHAVRLILRLDRMQSSTQSRQSEAAREDYAADDWGFFARRFDK